MQCSKCGSYAMNDDPSHVLCDCCWRDKEIARQRATIAHLKSEIEMYEGMKDGVAIRITDLETMIAKQQQEIKQLMANVVSCQQVNQFATDPKPKPNKR